MTVCRVNRYAVVSVPTVNSTLDLASRDGGDYGPWWLCVVGLAGGPLVQLCVVNHSPWAPIRFGCDDHSGAPGDGVIDWNFFQYTKLTVTVQTLLYIFLPVKRDLAGSVNSDWDGISFHEQAKRRGVVHERKWLVFAAVECTTAVSIQDIFLDDWQVFLRRCTRQHWLACWW